MPDQEKMRKFLLDMGCRRIRNLPHVHPSTELYVLDSWDSLMYLLFDVSVVPDVPAGTVDIRICKPGCSPFESKDQIEIMQKCSEAAVLQFLLGLGIDRFSKKTIGFIRDQLGCEG